jgi:L-ascorbate metabolism protein UlaG (beta-lactamase superfamily)
VFLGWQLKRFFMESAMILKWLGTAGFEITAGDRIFLIDPYLTRNKKARPIQTLQSSDFPDVDAIFITHGHFDHIYDVPVIASRCNSKVYCGTGISPTMVQKDLDRDRITEVFDEGSIFEFGDIQAQAFKSRHVKFDRLLFFRTLARINIRIPNYLPLMREYPVGQVLSWRFTLEGKTIHHFGSAGSTAEELMQFENLTTDVLLVPLQGHSRICEIALEYVKALKPKMVIPHHQDDFYPPISSLVNIQPFVDGVKQSCRDTEIKVLDINATTNL